MEPSTLLALGSSAVQLISGFFGGNSDKKDLNNLISQRKAYVTPDEILKIMQAAQNNASEGYDPITLNYLTTQTDRAFGGAVGTANRLGANPNDIAALFDSKMNSIMKIGAENHAENMKNFSTYLGAMGTVAENKAAELKSEQDILKDKIQAKAGQVNQDNKNVGNALNTAIGALSANETANMYNPSKSSTDAATSVVSGAASGSSNYSKSQWDELASILNYKGDRSWAANALPYNDNR